MPVATPPLQNLDHKTLAPALLSRLAPKKHSRSKPSTVNPSDSFSRRAKGNKRDHGGKESDQSAADREQDSSKELEKGVGVLVLPDLTEPNTDAVKNCKHPDFGIGFRMKGVIPEHQLFNGMFKGIDDPVFRYASRLVNLTFRDAVILFRGRRKNLHDEIRNAFDLCRSDDRFPATQHNGDVRLNNLVFRQLHVTRSMKYKSQVLQFNLLKTAGKKDDRTPPDDKYSVLDSRATPLQQDRVAAH